MGVVEIITIAFGGGGIITGCIALYHARPNKDRIDAETFKQYCDEIQQNFDKEREESHRQIEELKNERDAQKKDSAEYRTKTDKKISGLYDIVNVQKCAIFSAYRCPLPSNIEDCPVIHTLNKESKDE